MNVPIKSPFVQHPVLCGECGEMLYSPWSNGQELIYYHSTFEDRSRSGNYRMCPNMGKKWKMVNRVVELEEVPE